MTWLPLTLYVVTQLCAMLVLFTTQCKIYRYFTILAMQMYTYWLCATLPTWKKYGYDPVLARFVDEINRLCTEGFCGNFPLLGQRQVFVGLCNVAGDNLALNSLFGFVESFSTDYFCTMCLCTQAEIQTKFYENQFVTRTVNTYNKDIVSPCYCHWSQHWPWHDWTTVARRWQAFNGTWRIACILC